MLISSVPSLRPPARIPGVGDEVLAVSDISKVYTSKGFFGKTNRQVHAVDRVSLTIRRGETLGVVGESGSGKSTLARCIIRLIDPSSGSIRVDGVELAGLPEARLRACRQNIQMVFQDPFRSLNPRRKIGDSIIEGPMNFGMSEAAARASARDLIGLVGLPPRALERYPHQFSGGQRQRIAIARALAMEPKLLIADEAVSALDVSVQARVLDLLDNVRRQFDLAMLFITHDLRVAAQICDRIAVMKDGRIVEQGPTAEVFAAPRHEYTRSLFEAAPGHAFDFQGAARLAGGVESAG
jgi:peptide/nickel transport system ATP-binding protein